MLPQIQIENARVEKSFENNSIPLEENIGQFGGKNFTVFFWFKTSENSRYFDIAGNRIDGSHGNFLCIRMTGKHETAPEGMLCVEVDENGYGLNYIPIESKENGLNDGKWHHVFVVRKENKLSVFIDGQFSKENTGSGVANIKNPTEFRLGRSYSGFENVEIEFRDFRIYQDALVEEDLKTIYQQAFDVYGDETKVLRFEERDA